MAMLTWLLLSLLMVQIVTGRDVHHLHVKDARDTLPAELKDLVVPKQLEEEGI